MAAAPTPHDSVNPVGAGSCGCDSCERIRALEAEVKQLKDEKRALIEALEVLPKLAALRQSIESELLSEAREGEEIDAK